MIVVLVGKSATGKDTILNNLVHGHGFERYVPCTTRPIRPGETNGKEYHFLSEDEFTDKVESNGFIESRSYHTLVNGVPATWYYGTPVLSQEEIDKKNWAIILDVDGAKNFSKHYGEQNCIIVGLTCAPELRRIRALKRGGFDETEWRRRLEADDQDFAEFNSVIDNCFDTGNSSVIKVTYDVVKMTNHVGRTEPDNVGLGDER